jgi:hypothetical protein
MSSIVYLIQPEELVGTNRYKFGCSKREQLKRLSEYKKGTKYIIIAGCDNPFGVENEIKKEFNKHFKLIAGKEFFEGDIKLMKIIFCS